MNLRSVAAALTLTFLSASAQTAPAPAAAPAADPWKNIQLGGEGGPTLSLGGRLRVRTEHWDNFALGAANDDDFQLYRAFLNADLRLSPALRVFVEGVSAHGDGRDLPGGNRDIDTDSLDLQQAFVELTAEFDKGTLSLTPGRQELNYGKQRLLSPLDWVNTRRAFDAVKVSWKEADLKVDAFASRLVQVDRHDFNDDDSGQDLHGLYITRKVREDLTAATYLLYLDKDDAKFGASTNDEERITVGLHLTRKPKDGAFDWDAETAWQTGDFGDQDINAWMISLEAGYTLAGCPASPRLYAGYDRASGDGDPADDKLNTFNQLFPLGHAFFGYIDLLGRQNIRAYSVGMSCKPVPTLTLRLDGHLFERDDASDAMYNAGGVSARAAGGSDKTDIGSEVDLLVRWEACKRSAVLLGYSRFFAGAFPKDTGAHEDIDFAYASVEFSF